MSRKRTTKPAEEVNIEVVDEENIETVTEEEGYENEDLPEEEELTLKDKIKGIAPKLVKMAGIGLLTGLAFVVGTKVGKGHQESLECDDDLYLETYDDVNSDSEAES